MKFKMVKLNNPNKELPLDATNLQSAALEALEILGWRIAEDNEDEPE